MRKFQQAIGRRKSGELRWIEIYVCSSVLKSGVIWQQKPVLEVGPDRVLDHNLPQHGAELSA